MAQKPKRGEQGMSECIFKGEIGYLEDELEEVKRAS